MTITPIKRALLSVYDKSGIVEFAQKLVELGVEIISTGGTSQALHTANIPHLQVEAITGMKEMLGGRVKTLHPLIHGGILGKRDKDQQEASKLGLQWIDLVVVNFYAFNQVKESHSWDEAVELIDIGGPTMVRAAAKNFKWVSVVVDTSDYAVVIDELKKQQGIDYETRKKFAQKAFKLTSQYDTLIQAYLSGETVTPALQLEKPQELRYGENPHQKAFAYAIQQDSQGLLTAVQQQGKPLSYNNLLDSEAAVACVREFDQPACVIVKHANPCGVAVAADITTACEQAQVADAQSAFGGIVALNRDCNEQTAKVICNIFTEVVIAPGFSKEALAVFSAKPNMRILQMPMGTSAQWEMRFIEGGVLMQEKDLQVLTADQLKVVTKRAPTAAENSVILFAWRVVKHIKSNAILIAKNHHTCGIGAGQVSRVDAVKIALEKTIDKTECVLASDAFFPFRDSIDMIAAQGIRTIVQPGGSVRDDEVIAACNEHDIAMVFTGKRCFKH